MSTSDKLSDTKHWKMSQSLHIWTVLNMLFVKPFLLLDRIVMVNHQNISCASQLIPLGVCTWKVAGQR